MNQNGEEDLREIGIRRTEAQTDGSICADDLKDDAKDVKPWFFRVTDYSSSLHCQFNYSLSMGLGTYLDDTDQPKREGEPPHVESELTSSTVMSDWPVEGEDTHCQPT
jgi:hypothetical protein